MNRSGTSFMCANLIVKRYSWDLGRTIALRLCMSDQNNHAWFPHICSLVCGDVTVAFRMVAFVSSKNLEDYIQRFDRSKTFLRRRWKVSKLDV
jgi:hypothetical protein